MPEGDFASNKAIISAPVFSSAGDYAYFASVAAKNKQGTFIYEGFRMDLETESTEQLTHFHEHVTNPVPLGDRSNLIVTVDNNFAGKHPDYSYWQISYGGDERKQVLINMPDS